MSCLKYDSFFQILAKLIGVALDLGGSGGRVACYFLRNCNVACHYIFVMSRCPSETTVSPCRIEGSRAMSSTLVLEKNTFHSDLQKLSN